MFKQLFYLINRILFKYFSLRPENKLIYFESFHGKKLNDNPYAVYQYIQANHPEYKCVFGVKKGYEQPFIEQNIPFVYRFSKDWYKSVARARFWVINTRTKAWIRKSKHTKFIQTWHGTPLKTIGLDIKEANIGNLSSAEYHQTVKLETANWDVVLSASNYTSDCFKTAFALEEKQLLEIGFPRNDKLLVDRNNQVKLNKIKKILKVPLDKKIILYAPTWREDQMIMKDGTYCFELPFSLERFARENDAILLVRMHYLVSEQLHIPIEYQEKVKNVSAYQEMSDLLLISDLLITDYSSCFFDYALLNKPMLFYLYDRKHYEEELRGLYDFDLEALPGKIVETEDNLFRLVNSWIAGEINLPTRPEAFLMKYNNFETGHAAEKLVEWMLTQEEIER